MSNVKRIISTKIEIPLVNGVLFGLVRSTGALCILVTLMFTRPNYLITPSALNPAPLACDTFPQKGLIFCVFPKEFLWLASLMGCLICVLAISGFLIKISSALMIWLALSMFHMVPTSDGGEQIALVLSVLIFLVSLGDTRISHWHPVKNPGSKRAAWSFVWVVVIKLQMFVVYFHAGVAKIGVESWADGSEIYYDLLSPMFGSTGLRQEIALTLISSGPFLMFVTWGTIFAEIFIAFSIFGPTWTKIIAVFLAVTLHLLIAVFLGIVSFSIVMIGAAVFAISPFSHYSRSLKFKGLTAVKDVNSVGSNILDK